MRIISRRILLLMIVAVLALGTAATAFADPSGIIVKPGIYDPGHTGIVQSGWVPGQGEPGGDTASQGLLLAKNGPTDTNAAAGATIKGVDGITLTELGFDYRNDGHCGAGAPRFDVFTTDGTDHFFGCHYGTHTDLGNSWTQVRFAGSDAFPPVTSGEVVSEIDIVFDEGTNNGQGFVYLDNIDVNGAIAGKPGLAKFPQ